MDLEIDKDVKAVAEFMQERIEASRLVSVADGVARMAPILWGRYPAQTVYWSSIFIQPHG
jgi:hypothetical protein